jgi:hypothetical protein
MTEQGTVGISTNNGWLMLRFPKHPHIPQDCQGKRINLGLRDDKTGRTRAGLLASQVQVDILENRFNISKPCQLRQ